MSDRNQNVLGGLTAIGVGIAVGAAIGVLFAPVEGKKTRVFLAKKMKEWVEAIEESEEYATVKRVFGQVSKSTVDLYERIQLEVIKNVEELRITLGSIDKQAYYTAVERALMTFSNELDAANARTMELRAQLKAEAAKLPDKAPAKIAAPAVVEKKAPVKKARTTKKRAKAN